MIVLDGGLPNAENVRRALAAARRLRTSETSHYHARAALAHRLSCSIGIPPNLQALALAELGNADRRMGDLPAADRRLAAAASVLRHQQQPNRRDTAAIASLWASVRDDAGDFASADALARRALQLYETSDPGKVTAILVKAAPIATRAGDPCRGVRWSQRSIDRLHRDPAATEAQFVMAAHNLAYCLTEAGKTTEARSVLDATDGIVGSPDTYRTWLEGRLAEAIGDLDQALHLYRVTFENLPPGISAALALLDTARVLDARDAFTDLVSIAAQILQVLSGLQLQRDASDVLSLLARACRRRRITIHLLHRAIETARGAHLRRAPRALI